MSCILHCSPFLLSFNFSHFTTTRTMDILYFSLKEKPTKITFISLLVTFYFFIPLRVSVLMFSVHTLSLLQIFSLHHNQDGQHSVFLPVKLKEKLTWITFISFLVTFSSLFQRFQIVPFFLSICSHTLQDSQDWEYIMYLSIREENRALALTACLAQYQIRRCGSEAVMPSDTYL